MIKRYIIFTAFKNLLATDLYLAFANIISIGSKWECRDDIGILQNLSVILASLLVLGNHRADYTLYIAIAAIVLTSIRLIFVKGSGNLKISLFLVQGFIFAFAMWYILFPERFIDILKAF